MSDVIDWSKAPEGATQYVINSAGPWEKIEDGKLYYWYKGDWLKLPWRGDDSCSELKIVKRPQPAPWSGEGLPPVGTVCEVKLQEEWSLCEVIAHFQQPQAIVAAFTVAQFHGGKKLDSKIAKCFRHIRTPEQIAADEREAAILDMERICRIGDFGS